MAETKSGSDVRWFSSGAMKVPAMASAAGNVRRHHPEHGRPHRSDINPPFEMMPSKTSAVPLALAMATLSASAQILSIDLSNYQRVGRYDLPEPTRTTAPSGNLLAQEASGVTYNKDTGTLFVIGDGGKSVTQVSKTGQLVDTMTLAADVSKPRGIYFDDPEGITYVTSGTDAGKFVLVEERNRLVSLFTYVAGTTLGPGSSFQSVKLGTTIGNVGIEGLSFDPATGGYVAVKESGPMGIFQTGIDFALGNASNGSASTANSVNLFDPALAGTADFGDVFALSNILPGTSGQYEQLLVLSQESGKIVQMDRAGNILSSLTITSDLGNPLTVADQQHEGLTMDTDGNLYVLSENGGGDIDHPQLWVYSSVSPVPEPSAYAVVVGLGALAFGIFRRVRKSSSSL